MLQSAYPYVLTLHNWLRWVVLLAGLLAIGSALAGWGGSRPSNGSLRRLSTIFVSALDLELVIGLVLYFALSPITLAAMQNFGAAMKQKEPRFFAVEHLTFMLLAVVCAHIGSVMARKGATDAIRHRRAAIAYVLSLLLILGGIPWWRPLLRF